jgi:hypothetical protein
VPIGTLVLTNSAAAGSGSITIRSLSIAAADRDYAAVAAGAFAVSVRAYRDGTPWASASLGPDTVMANLIGATPLDILPESPVALELRLVARAGGAAGAFRLGIDDTGIGVVQPPSALLSVGVLPRSGRTFPMWTEVASFAPAGLAASTSNFPNPFAAGRERTTFVFQLPAPGRVTLTIWTARGERVRTLLEGAGCAGGLHQDVTWDGLNGRGLPVTNGVYVAELIADIDGGGRERVLRKVMVVR